MVSWAAVKASPVPDDGPPSNWEQKEFWTPCESDFLNPLGACRQYGFSITRTPDGGFTKARQVNRWWSGGVNKCSDAPKRVRFFCSKVYTKAYWQGTAPTCGSKEYNEQQCRENGYKPLHYTSDYGDGAYCSWSGTKVLCVKE